MPSLYLPVSRPEASGDQMVVPRLEKVSQYATHGNFTPLHTVLELFIKRCVLNLKPLAVEGVVLWLFSDGCNEVVFLCNLSRLHDLNRRPLRGTLTQRRIRSVHFSPCGHSESGWTNPVICQVEIANALRKALDDFLHRCANIWTMGKDDVDIWLLHALETALETLNNMLPRQPTGVWLLATSAKEDLCRQDVFVSWPRQLLQSLSHLNLALSVGVDLGCVLTLLATCQCKLI